MDRFARTFVVTSTALAACACLCILWFLFPTEAFLGAASLAVAFALGKLAPAGATRAIAAGLGVAPAVLFLALGRVPAHVAALWLFPALGLLLATGSWTRWALPPRWRMVLLAWSLAVAASWPVCVLRELDFVPSLLGDRSLFSGIGLGPPPVPAGLVAFAALNHLVGFLWIDWLFGRYRGERRRHLAGEVLAPLCAGAAATCLVSAYQALVDITWLSYGNWPALGRAVGTLLDANASGMLAALCAPLAVALVWNAPHRSVLSVLVLVLASVGVWTSGSRAAFVALAIVIAFVAVGAGRQRPGRGWVVLGAAALVIVGLAFGPMRSTGPLRRIAGSASGPPMATVGEIARELHERDGYGLAANDMFVDFPMFGVGVGGFELLSTDYGVRRSERPIPRDSAQNWWRQQAAEFGLLGVATALGWTALVLVMVVGGARGSEGPGPPSFFARGAVVALGITSTFGGYYLTPALVLTSWTLLFWTATLTGWAEDWDPPASTTTRVLVGAWTLALVFTLGQYSYARGDLRPPLRAAKVGLPYAYGFTRGGVTPKGEPFWWTGRHAVLVFPVRRQVLTLEAVALHPGIEREPVRVQLRLRGTTVVDRLVDDHTPVVVRLVARPGERALVLETTVSRLFTDDRGADRGLLLTRQLEDQPGAIDRDED